MKDGTPVSKGWLFCGGSLIHPRWVLTAAHCLEPEPAGRYDAAAPGDLVVVEGTSVLAHSVFGGGRENGRKLRASRVVMHEQWNARSVENDIALIELASPAASKPIAIAFGTAGPDTKADKLQDGTFDAAGNMAIVTGWGRLRFSETNRPARLMQVRVPLVQVETCKRANEGLRGTIDHRNICAGEPAGGRDSCAGDSGGPMVVPNPDTGYVQVGIVSWGTPNGCGAPGFYGVYTRVSAFGDWVSAKTGIASPRERPAVASLPPRLGPKIAPGDRALLVGIGHYQDAKIALKGSANDVRNIERLLVGTFGYQSEQIMKLLDGDATRANILAAFEEWLIHESAPGARIFFYVSSHGAQVPDLNGDEEDGLDETIAPYDTRVEIQNGRKVLRNQIIDDEIDELLKRTADRTVTVVIDSCHSGTATRGDAARFELGTVKCLCAVLDDYDPRAAVMADAGTRSAVFRGGSRRAALGPSRGSSNARTM